MAGREFGGCVVFNECPGFLDQVIVIWGGRSNLSFFMLIAGLVLKIISAKIRKRAVTLGIPTGCAKILRVRKSPFFRICVQTVHSHFILEKNIVSLATKKIRIKKNHFNYLFPVTL